MKDNEANWELAHKALRRAGIQRRGWCQTEMKSFWRVAYRDWRECARITSHVLDELTSFRGFGILKTVYATDLITHVGRIRVNKAGEYDFKEVAKKFSLPPSDYNPSRRFSDH